MTLPIKSDLRVAVDRENSVQIITHPTEHDGNNRQKRNTDEHEFSRYHNTFNVKTLDCVAFRNRYEFQAASEHMIGVRMNAFATRLYPLFHSFPLNVDSRTVDHWQWLKLPKSREIYIFSIDIAHDIINGIIDVPFIDSK